MRIAFYAPLKSPNHPVVSGDRQVARLLIRALEHAGHTVELASELRAYMGEPDESVFAERLAGADAETRRLRSLWRGTPAPELWFTYHPYYKSPDLIGPQLASELSIPYVTAEASYSGRRAVGIWERSQASVVAAVRQAVVNLCLTQRDLDGLAERVPNASLAFFPPFVDIPPSLVSSRSAARDGTRLLAVGMMRPGDKLASYRMLAKALRLVSGMPWRLSIVGGGPSSEEVRNVFGDDQRITWHGELPQDRVFEMMRQSDIFVWPGCGEAFGLAYLEAQAAGLPVIAQRTAGVPEVVRDGETGLLTPAADVEAYAEAIARLLGDGAERERLGRNASRFVREERSLSAAADRLSKLLPGRATP